jgi:hypothetical protein
VLIASIIRAMDAARTSETSVYFNKTLLRCIQEGCQLPNTRPLNLKSLRLGGVVVSVLAI